MQLPFFNLKAVYVSPTRSRNWLNIYKNKKFAAFDENFLNILRPAFIGVFLSLDTRQQKNKINVNITYNNTKSPSL